MRRGRPRHPDLLTPREQEVLSLLREGLTNDQIAARLGISESGARYHVSEILSKLGVSSRHEAVQRAQSGETRRHVWAYSPLAWIIDRRTPGSLERVGRAASVGILVAVGMVFLVLTLGILANQQKSAAPSMADVLLLTPTLEVAGDQPTVYGPYRILPEGFARGAVPLQTQAPPWPPGHESAGDEELRQSPLFVEVHGIPDDIPFRRMHSLDATSGLLIKQEFFSDDGQHSISVTRRFVGRLPIEENEPAAGGTLSLRLGRVLDVEALFLTRSTTSPIPVPYTHIRFVEGNIETIVEGRNVPEVFVQQVAENVLKASRGE